MAATTKGYPSLKEPSISSLFLAILLIMAVYVFFLSDFFKIDDIRINGNSRLTAEEIIIYAGLDTAKSFFQIDAGEIKRKLERHQLIRSCAVEKRFPKTIRIKVNERKPLFLFKYGAQLVVISKDLYVMYIYDPQQNFGLPFVTGLAPEELRLGKPLSARHAGEIKAILSEVIPEIRLKIQEIHVNTEGQFSIVLSGQVMIELGGADGLEEKISNLNIIWRQKKFSKGAVIYLQNLSHPVVNES
ncbi:MAG: cell division protein FtsQ/DivIB [Bacillota bacterium]